MDFIKRFSDLMGETLHCSGTPEGLALSQAETQDRLLRLAEEERSLPVTEAAGLLPDFSEARRKDLEQCRFAVYAWIDEQMLNAPRSDAAGWLPLSLQCHYFGTTAAGREFFARLAALFDGLGVPAVAPALPGETVSLADPAWRMERAVGYSPEATGMDVLRVYALCLLYGFRGGLFDQPDRLARLRKASHELLGVRSTAQPVPADRGDTPRTVLQSLEMASYVLVPVGVCLAFWLFCADILANVPFRRF